jgi:hypothetical protein
MYQGAGAEPTKRKSSTMPDQYYYIKCKDNGVGLAHHAIPEGKNSMTLFMFAI